MNEPALQPEGQRLGLYYLVPSHSLRMLISPKFIAGGEKHYWKRLAIHWHVELLSILLKSACSHFIHFTVFI